MDNLEHGILMEGMLGSDPDLDLDSREIPPNEIEEFVKAAVDEQLCGKATIDPSWDEPMGRPTLEKRDPKQGKAARFEITEIDGERVSTAYDSAGNVVSMRWLLPEVAID